MKRIFNLMCSLSLTGLLLACHAVEKTQPERVDSKELAQSLFSHYDYEFEVATYKSSSGTSSLSVKKTEFADEDFLQVKQKLENQGWVMVESFNNFYRFCKDRHNSINALNPIYPKHYTRSGSEIYFTDMDEWVFGFRYSRLGINACEEYFDQQAQKK